VAILSTVQPKVQDLGERRPACTSSIPRCSGGEAADKGPILSLRRRPAEVVARNQTVLRAYSADVVHTGDVGSAQVAKAVNN